LQEEFDRGASAGSVVAGRARERPPLPLRRSGKRIEKALGQYIQELEQIRENLRTRQLQEEFDRGARMAKSLRATPRATPAPDRS